MWQKFLVTMKCEYSPTTLKEVLPENKYYQKIIPENKFDFMLTLY